jgi:predicted enzyme related to lactoylglutathione lyase
MRDKIARMSLKRRGLLGLLASAGSLPFLRTAAAPADAQTTPVPAPAATMPAERVLGIGGFFFRSPNPKALAEWYRVHLGIDPIPMSAGMKPWHQDAGTTAFAPFSQTTKYFETTQPFMVNFRVRSLDKMVAQLRAAGIVVDVNPDAFPNGRFARTHDPDGNPIELWEPAGG